MRLLTDNGDLIYADIHCELPAYVGPIPELEQSSVAIDLLNREYDDTMLADLFSHNLL